MSNFFAKNSAHVIQLVNIICVLRVNRISNVLRLVICFKVSDGKMIGFEKKNFGADFTDA